VRQDEPDNWRVQVSQEEFLTAAPALIADVLRQHGQVRIRAYGGSMFPAVRSGDVLLIRHCTADAVQPGDVVLVRDADRLFAHRLIEKHLEDREPFLVTRGDSHWRNDPARPASMLLGQLTAITRNGRVLTGPFDPTLAERARGLAVSELTRFARRSLRWFSFLRSVSLL
jgi:signal peptidase I